MNTDLEESTLDTTDETTTDNSTEPTPKSNSYHTEKRLGDKIAKLQTELDAYKARDKQRELEEMTEKERAQAERDDWQKKAESLLRKAIAAEFQLPPTLAARLVGSDEDSLREDAKELAKLISKPAVGTATNAARDAMGGIAPKKFKMSDARKNPPLSNTPEFRQALREGNVDLFN